jgi:hypothetical protein
LPILKQSSDLMPGDFRSNPVWVGVRYFDHGQPWYENADDQTYRAWTGPLPLQIERQFPFVRVLATFRLADGSEFDGCFNPASPNWDVPVPGRRMADGSFTQPKQWSARHGGSPLSIMGLLEPGIFVAGRVFSLRLLRDPNRRRVAVLNFYAAIKKKPAEVFPLEFYCDSRLFEGITAGKLDGLFSLPLKGAPEINNGESYLTGDPR